MRRSGTGVWFAMALGLWAAACSDGEAAGASVIRIGHFPNITHAPALVAHDMSRQGEGWFEQRTGGKVEWFIYNAGPSAMEALIAGSIDCAYVGPSPAVNAHLRSAGREVRVIAGATRGGSALVVKRGSPLKAPADFRGKRIATPQLGNTQDIACRAWLIGGGLKVTQTGGDVSVVPTQNPDQLAAFQRGDVEAVWTVEPWVSRLLAEADGEVLVDEHEAVTTVLVVGTRFLERNRDKVRAIAEAHDELIGWLAKSEADAQQRVKRELEQDTGRPIDAGLVAKCWQRMTFASAIEPAVFTAFADAAKQAGMQQSAGDLSRLVEKVR